MKIIETVATYVGLTLAAMCVIVLLASQLVLCAEMQERVQSHQTQN